VVVQFYFCIPLINLFVFRAMARMEDSAAVAEDVDSGEDSEAAASAVDSAADSEEVSAEEEEDSEEDAEDSEEAVGVEKVEMEKKEVAEDIEGAEVPVEVPGNPVEVAEDSRPVARAAPKHQVSLNKRTHAKKLKHYVFYDLVCIPSF